MEAKDLIRKLLVVDPAQRLTCEQVRAWVPCSALLAAMQHCNATTTQPHTMHIHSTLPLVRRR